MTDVRFEEPELERLAGYVGSRTGLVFPPYRRFDLERGLKHASAKTQVTGAEALIGRLETDKRVWERLIDEITIGETYFFREPEQFAYVRREVLPAIVALRGPAHRLRVWSAGCASGEEAYSLAIVLHEHGLLKRANLLGTDLSAAAIARAKAGMYRAWSLRNLDPRLLSYFVSSDEEHQVRDDIRERVRFEQLNLANSNPSPATSLLDLIFCRNVFIYLGPETLRQVSERLYDALAPGGYLMMGPSDPMLGDERFEIITTPAGIVYRRPLSELGAALPSPGKSSELERELARETVLAESGTLPSAAQRGTARRRGLSTGRSAAIRQPAERSLAPSEEDIAASAVSVRDLANSAGPSAAERACALAIERAPLAVELHYLHGLLLLELGESDRAFSALRRTLYLDRSLAIAHFTLGSLLLRSGDRAGAERAFRNAERAASSRAADEALPFSDGLSAGGLVLAAQRELGLIAAAIGVEP